jgi:hypothetical protein
MPDMTTGSLAVAGKLASVTQACTAARKETPLPECWGPGGASCETDIARRSTLRLRDHKPRRLVTSVRRAGCLSGEA